MDVGGTSIRAGLVSPSGKILKQVKIPTGARKGKETILKNIRSAIQEVWDTDAGAIGVGMAGSVDFRNGVYLQGPNLPGSFRRVRIAQILKDAFRVPVKVDNDVHCFVLGEARFGAAKGYKNVVGVTLGTGIGGGIIIDDRLYRGRDNTAGELGHMTMAEARPKTPRQKKKDLEAFASGRAVSRLFYEKTGMDIDALEVEKCARRGNREAKQVINTMSRFFAAGMADIIHVLNPDIIVVGGGVSRINAIWKPLRKELRKRVIFPHLATTPIVKARLGDDANMLGATLLSDDRFN